MIMSIFHPTPENAECRLVGSLALLRVSLGVFLLVWAVMKFVVPKGTIGIFKKFYGMGIDADLSILFGALQAVLAVAIIVGLWRTWSYGLGVLMHGFSQLASWQQTLDPWGIWLLDKPKMLFWAGVPVLAGFILLWLMRDKDAWSVDGRRASG
jgi:hypothetical protein